ncbi:unnamed protein product [Sphagnum troendelagicum]
MTQITLITEIRMIGIWTFRNERGYSGRRFHLLDLSDCVSRCLWRFFFFFVVLVFFFFALVCGAVWGRFLDRIGHRSNAFLQLDCDLRRLGSVREADAFDS